MSGKKWSIRYLLPGSCDYDACLSVNDDVNVMLELHRKHECKYIFMHLSYRDSYRPRSTGHGKCR